MKNEIRFGAPWAMIVKILTVAVFVVMFGMMTIGLIGLPDRTPPFARVLMVVTPLLILASAVPFMVRGYVLRDDELLIERLGWGNHIPLTTVVSVEADPDAMRCSIRLCGSGGLFGFFGWFRNGRLGMYRAYGTDPARTVVMKLTNRTIIVTPDDPQRFVLEVSARKRG
ncbi:MAG: hypothetical protein EPO07_06980 [Verrucomicrobia bacterium]|nr:MAG: hypothetical protein EPO07_06980 [Verrucomicrobiota bacterium]